jgi:hypothetical protein
MSVKTESALKDGWRLDPSLWDGGRFPSREQYASLIKRGRLLYCLDLDSGVPPVGSGVVDRPCNLLYHTATKAYQVRPPGGGWKGFARNELLRTNVEEERRYVASLHAVGVPVIVYQNENNFDSSQFTESEIASYSAELDPFVWAFSNPGRRFACTNKPAWRELLTERIEIRVGEYGADGVFLDNCTPFIHCRCATCRELYARATGGCDLVADMGRPDTVVADMRVFDYVGPSQIPKDLVPVESAAMMRYLEWRVDRAIDFYRELRRAAEQRIGRAFIHTSNGHIGIAEQSAVALAGVFDMVFSEDGYTAPPKSNGFNVRLGSAILDGEGCPFVITRVTESAPTASMVSTLAAEARALGGEADFWDFNYREDPALADAAKRIRTFHRKHADTLYAVERDFNDTAILYSWRSDLWTSAADSPSKMAAEMLEDLNQPYDILLVERQAHVRRVSEYKLLVVPHIEVLPDAWFDAIQQFLDRGGRVVSTGSTARLDERLRERSKRWTGDGWQHFPERDEKHHARSRKMIGIHTGFERPASPFAQAIGGALPAASVRLERAEAVLTLNRTRLPDGEAVHLVNRYCNVFPRIPTTPRTGMVLHVRPARPAARVTWLTPDAADGEEFTLDFETSADGIRIALPTLNVVGVVRIRYVHDGRQPA